MFRRCVSVLSRRKLSSAKHRRGEVYAATHSCCFLLDLRCPDRPMLCAASHSNHETVSTSARTVHWWAVGIGEHLVRREMLSR